jgi:sigma-E factor negative regulatory protein RseC
MEKEGNFGTIQHEGTVQKVNINSVLVKISSVSACSGCHAQGYCSLTGNEEKIINVSGTYSVKPGDTVTVLMKQSMGYKAVLLSYIIPFLIIIACMIVLVSFSVPELTTGLVSLAVLVPYYFILYLFRKRINKNFTFTIKT